MIVTGCDPGVKNFALTRIKLGRGPSDFTILCTKMLRHTVKNLKQDVREQLLAYRKELAPHLKADYLAMERYMGRGIRGNTSECVNIMIGATVHNHPCQLLTAASWKNAVNRVFSLPKLYRVCRAPPHVLDSALIAIYIAYQHHPKAKAQKLKAFSGWTIKDAARLVNQIQASYRGSMRKIPKRAQFIKELRQSFQAPKKGRR